MMLLLVSLVSVSFAEGEVRLVDEAELLSASEAESLTKKLTRVSEKYDIDVMIVTTNSIGSKDAEAFADDFQDLMGTKADGILLLVDMGGRQWHISTVGACIQTFTDRGLEYMEEQFVDELSDGEYAEAFSIFVSLCDDFSAQAAEGKPYDTGNLPRGPFPLGRNLLIALLIGFVVAIVITEGFKAQLKSVARQAGANSYVVPDSLQLTNRAETFMYRNVSRVRRQTNNTSGTRRSGSSTHRSSSGRSHGGRGGRF